MRTVEESGGNPCPPLIIGVGIGGTSEYAMTLVKKAVTPGVGSKSDDPEVAALEAEMLEKVNALGVGPQAVGGINTALAVNVLTYPTHITAPAGGRQYPVPQRAAQRGCALAASTSLGHDRRLG